MSDTISVTINGETREIPAGMTIISLISHLGLSVNRLAIERNLDILPRDAWPTTVASEGDRFEIVHLVGGG